MCSSIEPPGFPETWLLESGHHSLSLLFLTVQHLVFNSWDISDRPYKPTIIGRKPIRIVGKLQIFNGGNWLKVNIKHSDIIKAAT